MPSTWTPDRVETLARLWREGFSAAHIARELGEVSRNAVCGKVWRMNGGCCDPRRNINRKPSVRRAPRKTDRHVAHRQKRIALERSRAPTIRAPMPKPLPAPELPPLNLSIVELRALIPGEPAQCRWITEGEGADARYCGHETQGGAWCGFHKRLAYAPRAKRAMR